MTTVGMLGASLAPFSASEASVDAAASSSDHLTENVRVIKTVLRDPSARGASSNGVLCLEVSICGSDAVKDEDKPLGLRTVEDMDFDCDKAN